LAELRFTNFLDETSYLRGKKLVCAAVEKCKPFDPDRRSESHDVISKNWSILMSKVSTNNLNNFPQAVVLATKALVTAEFKHSRLKEVEGQTVTPFATVFSKTADICFGPNPHGLMLACTHPKDPSLLVLSASGQVGVVCHQRSSARYTDARTANFSSSL
jgi:hypothetical protein